MIKQATRDAVQGAAALLEAGELVAFPTETVYGLGADATNTSAVEKIYAAKGRPNHNPLIVHVHSAEQANQIGLFDDRAWSVAEALWPGPITLLLPKRPDNGLSPKATANLPSVALRIPAHPIAMEMLRVFGKPVVAPSANPSGSLSPTSADHVARHLGTSVALILAGGASTVGVESTILDLTGSVAKILRPGAIGIDELYPLIGEVVYGDTNGVITAPGQLARHYATNTPLRLNAIDVKKGEAFLGFGRTDFIGVEGVGFVKDMPSGWHINLSADGDVHQAATALYAALHELDKAGATGIAVQAVPMTGLGIAINDRLKRAAVPKTNLDS